jgi:hypothetical protein
LGEYEITYLFVDGIAERWGKALAVLPPAITRLCGLPWVTPSRGS